MAKNSATNKSHQHQTKEELIEENRSLKEENDKLKDLVADILRALKAIT
jgi:regulator of replication initiation timing